MKTVSLREVKAKLSEYCDRSQRERVLITRHGRPLALLIGVEERDMDQVLTSLNPDLFDLFREWRRQHTLSHEELRRIFAPD